MGSSEGISPSKKAGTEAGPVLLTGRIALAVVAALAALASRNRFCGFIRAAYAPTYAVTNPS
jgi:hypothetical protein